MDLLRLLVEAGPNDELRRLVFSNFSLLLSFLRLDDICRTPLVESIPGPLRRNSASGSAAFGSSNAGAIGVSSGGVKAEVGEEGGASAGNGVRLDLASPVARLMGVVLEGDVDLVTCVSDEHLTLLARGAARSR